jgi:tetratricopeptide (TPR) repeat protein
MRFYKKTNEDKIDTAYKGCFNDAKSGRPWLALLRLEDLAEEFPNDSHVTYAEALLRLEFLGQGLLAQRLFAKAFELDNNNTLAVFNAAKFAPNEQEFDKWSRIALKIAPNEEGLKQIIMLKTKSGSYHGYIKSLFPLDEKDKKPGEMAALFELILHTGSNELSTQEVAQIKKERARSLRRLDNEAESALGLKGEFFLPEDRLALHKALKEFDEAMVEGSPAFYDEEFWNFGSAWTYLMRQYEKAIYYADKAIEIRPHQYALPHLNKGLALWDLGRQREAQACLDEALKQARESNDASQLSQVELSIKRLRLRMERKEFKTLEDFLPDMENIWKGAGAAAEEEIHDEGMKKLEFLSRSLLQRVAMVGPSWNKAYVSIMSELLSFYSPEAAIFIIDRASAKDGRIINNIFIAALYLAGYSKGVMQRDASRLSALNIIGLDLKAIRRTFRSAILEVAAAASDELSEIDKLLKKELSRMDPLLSTLIADQEPVDEAGIARARRDILSKFYSSELPSLGLEKTNPYRTSSCGFIVFVFIISCIFMLGRLLKWW